MLYRDNKEEDKFKRVTAVEKSGVDNKKGLKLGH